jgi:hypothetical protein
MEHEWRRRGMDLGFWWESQKVKETTVKTKMEVVGHY